MVTEPTSKRAELVAGLRELADWYERHPDVPLPPYPTWTHCVLADEDEAGQYEVVRVADALDVPCRFKAGSADADREFGPVTFRAYYVSRQRSEDYEQELRYLAERAKGEAQ